MRTRRIIVVLAVAAIIVAPFAYGGLIPHLLYGKRIAGQVVDAETGKPLVGAHVAFFWESPITPTVVTGHNSREICYHAAATTTDVHGRFRIEAWQKRSTYDVVNVEPSGAIYADGYVPHFVVLKSFGSESSEHLKERFVVKRFSGERTERIAMLFSGLANHDCLYGGESQKSLYPMLKAIHAEARRVAETTHDEKVVSAIARLAAEAALAQDPNVPWDEGLTKAFIREHLQ